MLLLATLLREHALDANSTWMIGDRSYDFAAARANRIRSLAAGWGYGSPGVRAGRRVAATPADMGSGRGL